MNYKKTIKYLRNLNNQKYYLIYIFSNIIQMKTMKKYVLHMNSNFYSLFFALLIFLYYIIIINFYLKSVAEN
jgi:hypothetical protein